MNAHAPLTADPVAVRAFAGRLHAHAAAATAGLRDPGMLQLVRIFPDGAAVAEQYAIGEVDHMVDEAVRQSNAGFNVYVEARTVRKRAKGERGRGDASDTVVVFGLVTDDDADKGRGSRIEATPSLIVESSPGNSHRWFLASPAIPAERAKRIGAGLKARAGGDSDTGVITQPFRVAGTVNFPSRSKIARGRVAAPTAIVSLDGPVWTPDELEAAFPPPKPKAKARPNASSTGETGSTGRTSPEAEALAAETNVPKRWPQFFAAARAAYADGLSPDDFEALIRRHPDGCGGKFLEPRDRLRREVDRAWGFIQAKADGVANAPAEPTYADASQPIGQAREAVEAAIEGFVEAATAYRLSGDDEAEPPVHGLAVTTGVGKTKITARVLARHLICRRGTVQTPNPVMYAVPTHRLGEEIVREFAEHGIVARVFRGRQAPDPDRLGQPMCDDVEAVEIALSLGAIVSTACCKADLEDGTEAVCPFFNTCAYQMQKSDRPDVWIVAHQMLFQAQPALGQVEMVVVDEGFWQAGIRIPKRGLTLDEIGAPLPLGRARDDTLHNDIESFRAQLVRGLRGPGGDAGVGGVRRENLTRANLTPEICTTAIDAEWRLKQLVPIWPGMQRADRRRAAKAATGAKHVRTFVATWDAARGLLHDEEATVSGRLYLGYRDDDAEGRTLVVKARGVRAVVKPWRVPTLLLDATLPDAEILQALYPQVEVPEPIEAAMPHVRVRQVLGAPVAAGKLKVEKGESAGRNLRAIRREVLRRFVELGRDPLLVIAQKAVAEWLRGSGLPAGVAVEHFNNVAGLDRYRDVRGLMVIGRTIPSPAAVEALAGALTGREGAILPDGQWYGKAVRGIRLRDGSPAGVECDAHPEPIAEACRWQICEGELMQALGRARGVNRAAATPLAIDVLADVCLPLTVDDVERWSAPGEEVEMLADGVVLDSSPDMSVCWPAVWPTDQSARHWIMRRAEAHGSGGNIVPNPYKNSLYIGVWNDVRRFRYQRPGPKQKWRTGAHCPAAVPNIRAWLESRLGPLAGFNPDVSE